MKNKSNIISATILTLIAAFGSTGILTGQAFATESADTTVIVNDACLFSDDTTNEVTFSSNANATVNSESMTLTAPSVSCNNINGFQIKAVGFSPTAASPSAGVEGATAMYGTNGTIATGTSGTDSYWGFKITSTTASTSATVLSTYANYSSIPATSTPVVSYAGSTSATVTGTFRPDYQIYVSPTQAAGTYTGGIKYIIEGN